MHDEGAGTASEGPAFFQLMEAAADECPRP